MFTNAHDLCQIICRKDVIFCKLWNDIPTFKIFLMDL